MKKLIVILCLFSVSALFSQNVKNVEVENTQELDISKELSKDKIDFYNQSFLKFVAALKASDKQAIDNLISEKVKTFVNDNIIQKLSGGISFERKTEVYRSGHQSLLDGMNYPAIEYKYADDISVPPRDIITVIFENDGKILGVKPSYSK